MENKEKHDRESWLKQLSKEDRLKEAIKSELDKLECEFRIDGKPVSVCSICGLGPISLSSFVPSKVSVSKGNLELCTSVSFSQKVKIGIVQPEETGGDYCENTYYLNSEFDSIEYIDELFYGKLLKPVYIRIAHI